MLQVPLPYSAVVQGLAVPRDDVLQHQPPKILLDTSRFNFALSCSNSLQPLRLIYLQATKLLAPSIVSLLRDATFPARYRGRLAVRNRASICRSNLTTCSNICFFPFAIIRSFLIGLVISVPVEMLVFGKI
jgi:hypothetical protein